MGEQISKDLERITLKFIDYKTIEKLTSSIDDKEFLVDILSHISRINTLSMIMFARSGHIGTSFSSMEIFQWLINYQLGDILDDEFENILIASKGHDAPGYYSSLHANKIIPDEKLRQLRRLDGLPGHPDVQSSFVSTNTGSLGMGISKAKGFIYSDRIKNIKRKVFVLCGDGEMQEGQNWEALRGAVNDKLGNLTVVIDNNKLQSDTLVNKVSDLGDLLKRFTSTGWIGGRV
jgi:transketolase